MNLTIYYNTQKIVNTNYKFFYNYGKQKKKGQNPQSQELLKIKNLSCLTTFKQYYLTTHMF